MASYFFGGYKEAALKSSLSASSEYTNIHINKKTAQTKARKKEIADLLRAGKNDKAKVKVECVISEDFVKDGYELLELYLEILRERVKLVTNSKEAPKELKQNICSIIWAEKLVPIDSLKTVVDQLQKKYGSKFVKDAQENSNNDVDSRLLRCLEYEIPKSREVVGYLKEIALTYNVDWTPPDSWIEVSKEISDNIPEPINYDFQRQNVSDTEMHAAEAEERRQFELNQLRGANNNNNFSQVNHYQTQPQTHTQTQSHDQTSPGVFVSRNNLAPTPGFTIQAQEYPVMAEAEVVDVINEPTTIHQQNVKQEPPSAPIVTNTQPSVTETHDNEVVPNDAKKQDANKDDENDNDKDNYGDADGGMSALQARLAALQG